LIAVGTFPRLTPAVCFMLLKFVPGHSQLTESALLRLAQAVDHVVLDDCFLALKDMAVLAFDLGKSLATLAYARMVLEVMVLALCLGHDLPALLALVVVPSACRLVNPVLRLLNVLAADSARLSGLLIDFHSLD